MASEIRLAARGEEKFYHGNCRNRMKTIDLLFEETRLTIEDVAERARLTPERVEAIAVGRWTPSPAERQKIAAAFNLTVSDIAWGHKTPVQHLYGHGPGGQTS